MYDLKRIIFGKPWESKDIKNISSILALKKTDIINSQAMDELINFKDRYDNTPLIMASKHASPRVVKFLLSKGANVLDKNIDGRSPLIEASMCLELRNLKLEFMTPDERIIKKNNMIKNYIEIIEILLLNGANTHDRDLNANTAIIAAFSFGNIEVGELLYKWTFILENNWPLKMLILVLQELFVYHHLDCESFIDFNQYFE